MRDGKDFLCVGRLYRTAIEKADPRCLGPDAGGEAGAEEGVDFGDFGDRGGAAGADGPDRFIGDDEACRRGIGRDGAVKLRSDHVERLARVAFGFGFADADDCDQPGSDGGFGLGEDMRVGFAMIGAAFGMTENHMGSP